MIFHNLDSRLRNALEEDGAFHDISTLLLPEMGRQTAVAEVRAKARGVFCGSFLIRPLFRYLDPKAKFEIKIKDGDQVQRGRVLFRLKARTRAILGGERTFLNLSCHLSGVATLTSKYVEAVKGTKALILDTRKTTPLWRDLEKYAVTCGGGTNHRMSLSDAVMVKDNHHRYLRHRNLSVPSVFNASRLRKVQSKKMKFILVEAKNYAEVWEGIKGRADIILLDNMTLTKLKGSMAFIQAARRALSSKTPFIEVSGGITISQARHYARMGADRISVGALTHSAPALDLSLEVL